MSLEDYHNSIRETSDLNELASSSIEIMLKYLNDSPSRLLLSILCYFDYKMIPLEIVREIYENIFKYKEFSIALRNIKRMFMLDEFEYNQNSYINLEKAFSGSLSSMISIESSDQITYYFITKLDANDLTITQNLSKASIFICHVRSFLLKSQSSESSYQSIKLSILFNKYSILFSSQALEDPDKIIERVSNLQLQDDLKLFKIKLLSATMLIDMNLFLQAKNILDQCSFILENNHDLNPCYIQLYLYVGRNYFKLGSLRESREYFGKFEEILKERIINDNYILVLFYFYFSDLLIELGELDYSEELVGKCRPCIESFKADNFNEKKEIIFNNYIDAKIQIRYAAIRMKKMQFTESLDYFSKTVELVTSAPVEIDQDLANTYLEISKLNYLVKNYSEAKEYLLKALRITESYFPLSSQPMAEIYFQLAFITKSLKDYKSSRSLFQKATDIFELNLYQSHPVFHQISYELADMDFKEGNFENFQTNINSSFSFLYKTVDQNNIEFAKIWLMYAEYCRVLNFYNHAIKYYQNSLDIQLRNKSIQSYLTDTYLGLGISYRENNDFKNSWKCLNSSLKIIEQYGNEQEMDNTYIQILILCIEEGKKDEFNKYMQKLTTIREKREKDNQDPGHEMAELNYYYVKFYYSFKSYDMSEKYLNQALEIYGQSPEVNKLNLAKIFYQLALVSIKTNKINEAKRFIENCLRIREEVFSGLKNELLEIYLLQADFYYNMFRKENKILDEYKETLKKALRNLDRFIEDLKSTERNRELSKVYVIIGKIYAYLDEFEKEAEYFLNEGLNLLNLNTDSKLIIDARISLGVIYQDIQHFDKSIEQFEWIKDKLILNQDEFKDDLIFVLKQLYQIYYSTQRNSKVEEIHRLLLKIDPSSV